MNSNYQKKIGRISEVRKNSFVIYFEEQEVTARLKGSFHERDQEMLPVVGDLVRFIYNPYGDSSIQEVCERKSLLMRPDQAKTGVMQYMVANVDHCFIVTSLNDDYNYNRIARYAAVALQGGAVPVVILTKADLCTNVRRYLSEVGTISDSIRVHAVSALLNVGLDELDEYFKPGNIVCLMGSSGAGKSTLINAVAGREIMETGSIREADSKGRHTTTRRKLIRLDSGAFVIDTPGMREIGMSDAEKGIDDTFSDIVELGSRCRFRNCRHESEPGCAVKEAISRGELSRKRYLLFRSLGEENTNNYAKKKEVSKIKHSSRSKKKSIVPK